MVLELVHMIDTGGQPELIEVMPSLIHNANLAMVLVSLEYGLNECPEPFYFEKGKSFTRQMSSHYTGRDIILKLASTLQAKQSVRESFNLYIVATHRDCVKGELKDEVETLNNKLHSLLLPTFKNELIMFEASTECNENKIAFVLNLKAPNDDDKEALELIRTGVSKSELGKTFDTPASFFVFEQDLLQYAKDVANRSILSLDECKQVGANVKMSGETVEAALVFFHRQNTFLYFRHVLPNHIFIEPQIPFDIVNSIVRFSYKTMHGIPAKQVLLLKNGIITEELLSYDHISPHFVKGFYEVKDAIKLFCHTFTLAPLQPSMAEENPANRMKKEYLMMCLKPAIPNKELDHYIPKSSDTVPLVVKFSSGCAPLGCFGSTIACLLSKYGWEVHRERGLPKCLAHNIASLHDPDLRVNIVLVDFTQYYKIFISSDLRQFPAPARVCSQVRRTVFGAVENVFEIMHLDWDKIKISPAVVCECTSAHHFAEFSRNLLYCSKSTSEANEKQLLWMGEDLQPDLTELLRLKIPEKVGVKYFNFGINLLGDKTGQQLGTFQSDCHYKAEPIVKKILRSWLTREPTPVTWGNLIQTLRKSNLSTLADDVERFHSTGECSSQKLNIITGFSLSSKVHASILEPIHFGHRFPAVYRRV